MTIEDIKAMKPRDTFWMQYGYSHRRFIVKAVTEKGIFFTMPSWMKSNMTFISFSEIISLGYIDTAYPAKPYSKLRWLLKF